MNRIGIHPLRYALARPPLRNAEEEEDEEIYKKSNWDQKDTCENEEWNQSRQQLILCPLSVCLAHTPVRFPLPRSLLCLFYAYIAVFSVSISSARFICRLMECAGRGRQRQETYNSLQQQFCTQTPNKWVAVRGTETDSAEIKSLLGVRSNSSSTNGFNLPIIFRIQLPIDIHWWPDILV